MKLQILIGLFLCIGFNSYAQRSINSYKYVVVPDYYTFLKNEDQYQLNSFTKFLFNKYGFQAFVEGDDYPNDLSPKSTSCNTLFADIISESNFLNTGLKVSLADCEGNVIYISEKGRSKEKEYKKSYYEALRKAFTYIQELEYVYTPKEVEEKTETTPAPVTTRVTETKNTIEEKKQDTTIEKEVDDVSPTLPVTVQSETAIDGITIYSSANSNFSIHRVGNGYTVYDGDQKIGDAKETSTGTFLVQTSVFNGIGRIEDAAFLIERSIEGVDGLVKMTFTKQ